MHCEPELGFDADGKEVARGNFRWRIKAGWRENARRERSGSSDKSLRFFRSASDFVADYRQFALAHERFLDRVRIIQSERRAARRQPLERVPTGARVQHCGHRLVQVFGLVLGRYHLIHIGARREKKKAAASDTRMSDYVAHRGTGTCTQVQLLVGHWLA